MNYKQDDKNKIKLHWKDAIHAQQYNQKLNKLLHKIQVQNRYSNRITNLNSLNLSKLQHSLHQLQQIKQIRKIQQINQVQLKNLNSDLNKQILNLKQYLQLTSKSYLQAKKQIKQLILKNTQLQKQNYTLNSLLLQNKKKQINQLIQFHNYQNHHLLQNQIKLYLDHSKWKPNFLVNFCQQCLIKSNFSSFFHRLQQKIQFIIKQHKQSKLSDPHRWQRSKSMNKQYIIDDSGDKKPHIATFEIQSTQRTNFFQQNKLRKKITALFPVKCTTIN